MLLVPQNPLVVILGVLLLPFLDPLVEESGLLLLVFLGLFGLGLPLLLHTLDALLNVHHRAWARLLGCQEKTKTQGYRNSVLFLTGLSLDLWIGSHLHGESALLTKGTFL